MTSHNTLVLNIDEFVLKLPLLKKRLWLDLAQTHKLEISELFLMASFDANQEKQEKLMREYPHLAPFFEEINTRYNQERQVYLQNAHVSKELNSLFEDLKQPLNLVLCTNLSIDEIKNLPVLSEFKVPIQELFSTKEVFAGKPDADIYLKIARKLGIHASKLITIDATINGVQAGYLAHTKAIYVAEYYAITQAVQDYSTAFLNTLSDLKTTLNTWLINQSE